MHINLRNIKLRSNRVGYTIHRPIKLYFTTLEFTPPDIRNSTTCAPQYTYHATALSKQNYSPHKSNTFKKTLINRMVLKDCYYCCSNASIYILTLFYFIYVAMYMFTALRFVIGSSNKRITYFLTLIFTNIPFQAQTHFHLWSLKISWESRAKPRILLRTTVYIIRLIRQ